MGHPLILCNDRFQPLSFGGELWLVPGKWLMVALAACFLSSGIEALGQSTFGSIVGTVKDQSGSVVPGATVTLVNQGSSATRTVTSGASGAYEFLNLDAGIYQVSIQATGFKDAVFDHLVL
jgi:hypothetical protein